MGLFERLSEDEKHMMERYIDSYASFNGTERTAPLEHIMRIWNKEKEPLFHMLNDQFIISKDIVFTKDTDQIIDDLDSAIYGYNVPAEDKVFLCEYDEFVDSHFPHTYRHGSDEDNMYYNLHRLIGTNDLATNIYSGDSFELSLSEDEKPIKINTGCKCTRALGKIAAAYGLHGFERFRILHSQCLNQKKLTGHLCLSIHPLDYMTMSDNECGWSSCMSWQEEGCYRQGTVEMMNSPMVIVAYLTSEEDMRMPGGDRWNNKKWRQLFIVDQHMIGNVKAYPYRNDYLTKDVLAWIKELAEAAGMGPYDKDVIEYDSFNFVDYKNRQVKIYPRTRKMYNDFSSHQFAYFNVNLGDNEDTDYRETVYLDYSGESECMCCGDIDCDFEGEGCLVGTCCEERYYCDCCESYFSSDEGFMEVDGQWICPDCIDNQCAEDSFSGDLHFINNMRDLHISFDGGKTVWNIPDIYISDDSLYARTAKEIFKPYCSQIYEVNVVDSWRRLIFVKAEEVHWERLLEDILTSWDTFENLKNEIESYYCHYTIDNGTIRPIFSEPLVF